MPRDILVSLFIKENEMPVPKSKRKKYGIIIASQIKRLKRKGKSKKEAVSEAKSITEKWLKHRLKKKK